MRPNISISLMLATAVVGFQSNAKPLIAQDMTPVSKAEEISKQKQELALQFSERYQSLEANLKAQITEKNLSASVSQIQSAQPYSAFSRQLQQADQDYRTIKGVEDFTDSLIELRIADASMVEQWKQGESPLFAFEPAGDDSNWQYIEAYDIYGQLHQLDVYEMPDVPVLVVDSNGAEELRAGLQAMQAEMQRLGQPTKLTTDEPVAKPKAQRFKRSAMAAAVQPLSTTQLTKIRLNDDQEPWISGKAEIYAIITGVDPSRDAPQIDLVEMPYLDYDGQDYYPGQTIIIWPRYRWGAVDMVLMEQDDGTDYKELAKLLVKAAEEILKMIPDPEVQGYAIIAQITGKIIDVIPDGLLTNDDDYVDVYYTLMQNTPYVDRPGAGGNATATFKPVTINPTE
ncbi:DUF3103 domain-containing protein [Vibrio tubiashii]|uniref:DUF3103 domain-containing protein n=1 Tax=Vibrio tubiashii TaxID=29498 RepID=UPI001EFE1993|nr:DUF3103 domain-containing protein [Vibrio tubiashii]MCG9580205.1 DUF3103 domain-containing protein [Vibrio tubiashii]MCG9613796.1 DUF3103 domain-containing protein [Vibrio tubiashii]MCG9686402.1 DUF3103 domain-containing protein [Vibrio tubiashii]